MTKFHINPKTGNPGTCRAVKQCPYGDLEKDHYATKEEARATYEALMAGKNLKEPVLKDTIEDISENELEWGETRIYEVDTIFAQAVREKLGVTDPKAPVMLEEHYSQVGDYTIESYTSVTVSCGEKKLEFDTETVHNPLAAMIRSLETRHEEPPRETVERLARENRERLLRRIRDGIDTGPRPTITLHMLNDSPIVGKFEHSEGAYGDLRAVIETEKSDRPLYVSLRQVSHITVEDTPQDVK